MWEGPTKKWVKKNKKKIVECQGRHSAKNFFKKSDGVGGLGRQVPFFAECHSLPSVALGKEGFC